MRRSLTAVLATLLVPLVPGAASAAGIGALTGLSRSVATADQAQALFVNPAGLAFRGDLQLLAAKSWLGAGDAGLAATLGGLGLGYEQGALPTLDWQRTSLGLGVSLLPGLMVGLAGRTGNAGAGFGTLDAGLLWRPSDYISLGATARDLTMPRVAGEVQSRAYQAGVALRPGTDRFYLAADLAWREGDLPGMLTPRFELGLSPLDGLELRGAADLQGRFEVALSLGWAHGSIGHAQGFNGAAPVSFATYQGGFQRPFWVSDGSKLADLDLRGPIVESVTPGLFGNDTGAQSLARVLEQLRRVERDGDVAGVLVRLGGTQAGWASFDEIRQAFAGVQAAGKKVIVYLYGVDTAEYYLASGADQIVMHPMGELALRGVSTQVTHFKGLLDKLGVEADFVRIGEYKSAVEPMSQSSMSEANRRQLSAILDERYDHLVRAISQSRKLEPAQVKTLIDKGLFTAKAAKEAGLIDEALYEDQTVRMVAKQVNRENIGIVRLADRRPVRRAWQDPERIAVISASGTITEGRSGRNLLTGETVLGADSLVKAIRTAAKDERVRAVVLRIDSPGGSVTASDMIWHELVKLKEAGKPLVISMGNVAGSGGYWIATPADRIVADPNTITGSIGVFAGKLSLQGLYEKLGVTQEVLKRGETADARYDGRAFSAAERETLRESIEATYSVFLDRVAASRGLSRDEADSRGQGRIYTGTQAKSLKLVDELGGLHTAVELARTMAKLSSDKVEIVGYPDDEALVATLLEGELHVGLKPLLLERLAREQLLVLMPEGLLPGL